MTPTDVLFDAVGPRLSGRPGDRHSALSAVWLHGVLCVYPSAEHELGAVFVRAALGQAS